VQVSPSDFLDKKKFRLLILWKLQIENLANSDFEEGPDRASFIRVVYIYIYNVASDADLCFSGQEC
jgi:hypothetical protein